MENTEKNTKMTVKDKVRMAALAQKFDVKSAKRTDENGEEKPCYQVIAKAEDANTTAFVDDEGEFEIYPTADNDTPLNIEALSDMIIYCKLLVK